MRIFFHVFAITFAVRADFRQKFRQSALFKTQTGSKHLGDCLVHRAEYSQNFRVLLIDPLTTLRGAGEPDFDGFCVFRAGLN